MKRRLLESCEPCSGRGWASVRQHAFRRSGQGPASVEELFQWPARLVGDISRKVGGDGEGEARVLRLYAVLERGVAADSLYAGFDCPRWALSITVKHLIESHGMVFSTTYLQLEFGSACDWGEIQQAVLCRIASQVDGGSSSVFMDIRDRLPQDARDYMQ